MIKYIMRYDSKKEFQIFDRFKLSFSSQSFNNKKFYILLLTSKKEIFVGLVDKKDATHCEVVSEKMNAYEIIDNVDLYLKNNKRKIYTIDSSDFKKCVIHIRDLHDALSLIELNSKNDNQNILFRGQADKDWNIESSLYRKSYFYNKEKELFSEIHRINRKEFESEDFLHLATNMQHYGIPTRLIDWTGNLLNALYFSCGDEPKKDGKVFMVKTNEILTVNDDYFKSIQKFLEYRFTINYEHSSSLFSNTNCLELVNELYKSGLNYKFIKTKHSNDRIRSQDGYFSLTINLSDEEFIEFLSTKLSQLFNKKRGEDFERLQNFIFSNLQELSYPLLKQNTDELVISVKKFMKTVIREKDIIDLSDFQDMLETFIGMKPLSYSMNNVFNLTQKRIEIIIPSEYKKSISESLSSIGINSSTIYPDVEGMAKYLKEKYT